MNAFVNKLRDKRLGRYSPIYWFIPGWLEEH
jgi:hypothetical protein